MDKYLLSILQEVNTIIIPGLGALTLVNADKGEYMFMPYLKHDDGELAKYIAEKEGMEVNDAKNLIAKYVREILAILDKGEAYNMYQFGSFYKEDGEVAFKGYTEESGTESVVTQVENRPAEEENAVSDKEPETQEDEVEKVEETESKIIHTEEEESAQSTVTSIEEEDEVPYEEAQEAISELLETNEDADEPQIIPVPVETNQSETIKEEEKILSIVEKEEIEKGRQKIEKLKKIQENKPEKKKKSPVFWVLIVLLAIIIGGGTMFAINYNEWKQHIPFLADKKESPKEEIDHKDKMEEILGLDDEEQQEENIQEEIEDDQSDNAEEELEVEETENKITETEEIKSTPEPVRSNGSFHAIAGAFSSKDNADRLATKLKEQGYPAFVSQRGAMNWVSMKQFSSKEEANASLSELKGVVSQVWIFEGNL